MTSHCCEHSTNVQSLQLRYDSLKVSRFCAGRQRRRVPQNGPETRQRQVFAPDPNRTPNTPQLCLLCNNTALGGDEQVWRDTWPSCLGSATAHQAATFRRNSLANTKHCEPNPHALRIYQVQLSALIQCDEASH